MIIRKQQQSSAQSSQAGFTIIESLLAMLVVAVMMTAIAPVIVLATATRLQARRVELASFAAKAYVDGLQSGAIKPPDFANTNNTKKIDLPADSSAWEGFLLQLNSVPAPSTSLKTPEDCKAGEYCSTTSTAQVYCVDGNGDGKCKNTSLTDMLVQGIRSTASSTTDDALKGYRLSVRVYRGDAFDGGDALKKSDSTNREVASTFTGGLGDRRAPLVELTTDITSSSTTFEDYRERLGVPN